MVFGIYVHGCGNGFTKNGKDSGLSHFGGIMVGEITDLLGFDIYLVYVGIGFFYLSFELSDLFFVGLKKAGLKEERCFKRTELGRACSSSSIRDLSWIFSSSKFCNDVPSGMLASVDWNRDWSLDKTERDVRVNTEDSGINFSVFCR